MIFLNHGGNRVIPGIFQAILLKVFCILSLLQASSLQAAGKTEPPLTFQYNHFQLAYSVTIDKTGGSKSEVQQWISTPNLDELVLNYGAFHLHIFPLTTGAPFQAGFDVMDGLELGLTAGANSLRQDANNKIHTTQVGVFASKTLDRDSWILEFYIGADRFDSSSRESHEDGTVTKSKASGFGSYAGANAILPIAGGFSYLASIDFSDYQEKDSVGGDSLRTQSIAVFPLAGRVDF